MSTEYEILDNIEDNKLIFDSSGKTEEELALVVDSYLSGSGNNFQFDGDYFKDPATFENDLMVIKQITLEGVDISVLYQLVFNTSEEARDNLLDYNFNIPEEDISGIIDQSFEIIMNDFVSSPIAFDYDFRFCEEGSS